MSSWHSYPSVTNLGHPSTISLLDGEVYVEEKVDGSQFSFGVIDGVLRMKSKSNELIIDAPEKMFTKAVETVKQLQAGGNLHPEWTYRAEYLAKPKHNVLAYDRIPRGHLVIFDINTEEETYLPWREKAWEAEQMGLEVVPLLYQGKVESADQLRALLETASFLGGQKVEGVVIKPVKYDLFGRDKKVVLGKFVSEQFKEVAKSTWKVNNPGKVDTIEVLGMQYRSQARWLKAVQHLREAGTLEMSPRDIGALIKEVPQDVMKECREEILETLWKWAWPNIARASVRGLPEWYKQWLLDQQFGGS